MLPLDKDPGHIGRMFDTVSARYDLANHLLSFNQDRRWRRRLVQLASPPAGSRILDLCTGTGDLAIALAQQGEVEVWGVDISEGMLAQATKKTRQRHLNDRVHYQKGNALELPFPEAHFDLVTIAFGLRNLPDFERGLCEVLRVLKPAGAAFVLEFSQPKGLWGSVFSLYQRQLLPLLGGWITGHQAPYRYLDESIRQFPSGRELMRTLRRLGFQSVRQEVLSGGVALIHSGNKLD